MPGLKVPAYPRGLFQQGLKPGFISAPLAQRRLEACAGDGVLDRDGVRGAVGAGDGDYDAGGTDRRGVLYAVDRAAAAEERHGRAGQEEDQREVESGTAVTPLAGGDAT